MIRAAEVPGPGAYEVSSLPLSKALSPSGLRKKKRKKNAAVVSWGTSACLPKLGLNKMMGGVGQTEAILGEP